MSDRYHPAICAAVLGKPAQVLPNREPHKMRGLTALLADRPVEELQELRGPGRRHVRGASGCRMTGDPGVNRLRLLSLYPTFWPRQGGGQMVLAAIAEGLSSRLTNTVLTRRFANTGAARSTSS